MGEVKAAGSSESVASSASLFILHLMLDMRLTVGEMLSASRRPLRQKMTTVTRDKSVSNLYYASKFASRPEKQMNFLMKQL